ncbi:MAG TPA: xanthine dehydrogenase family protein subunit M [Thermoanaerobaculia bacterium]|nr:xanthine dehydrogenase family protein subunit M [Thermoanaerobaculia bacterium]
MRPFDYARASSEAAAIKASQTAKTKFMAGGTNLVDLMKNEVEQPAHVVDINGLGMNRIDRLQGGVRIGALVRMSDAAANPLIADNFPVIAQALLLSASPQLRNAASLGGNLMQRVRCPYFRELTWTPCNKRNPGSGCSAKEGENRMQAILGTSEACIATHPSDFAVALAALDGVLTLHGPGGERRVPATQFHLLPGDTPHLEHDLKAGELITSIYIPDAAHAKRSAYLKVRDRSSYEFALTSAAVALNIVDGTIRSARVAMGGVGTKPWRSAEAESVLVWKRANGETFRAAAEAAMRNARGWGENDFKIELGKRTLVRALTDLAGGAA